MAFREGYTRPIIWNVKRASARAKLEIWLTSEMGLGSVTSAFRHVNSKTSKLLRNFAVSIGIDLKTDKRRFRALKKAHKNAPSPEKARGTALMRKTLAATAKAV